MLLGSGKMSFLETLSKCLGSANLDLVGACLTTVAWMSHALSSLSNIDFQLFGFSSLFSRLKEILENGCKIGHKVLASVSLLNFCKIPGWQLFPSEHLPFIHKQNVAWIVDTLQKWSRLNSVIPKPMEGIDWFYHS